MPVLVLSDKLKGDLQFFEGTSPEVVKEFVRISLEFIRKGANPKLYNSAAKSLAVEVRRVEAVVEATAQLFAEAAKLQLSEADFADSLSVLGLAPDLNQLLNILYLEHRSEIRQIQKELSFDMAHYSNLDWRLDVQVASRALRSQLNAMFVLKLDTLENGETQSHMLQSDYTNLKHLADELDDALKEIRSAHVRRIARQKF
eukprot:TRINITY_DN5274_c2_g1_i1.p1 TRINITY_DN5274_c2_g1~~TRINITY_DN5274_c2_g1_i1.p1  ORF type:complete len:234 (+),score=53.67 TRINITY_DN5274_c2_g1_i1:102-704(+)